MALFGYVTKRSPLTKMTVGTLVSISIIFITAEKSFVLVKNGPLKEILCFWPKINTSKYAQIRKEEKNNYKMSLHIWVNTQIFVLVAFNGDSNQ